MAVLHRLLTLPLLLKAGRPVAKQDGVEGVHVGVHAEAVRESGNGVGPLASLEQNVACIPVS